MGMYKYREVICPWCKHRFMWNQSTISSQWNEYVDEKTGESIGLETSCPMCSEKMIVVKGKLEGLFPDKTEGLQVRNFRGI